MRYVRSVVAVLCVFAFIGLALAQEAIKPTRVVLTLNDGKTVSGELVEATPAGVTLKPNPKAAAVMTPWSQIKRAGGGLSRQKIVDEWRQSKHELLCDVCDGSGATTCPTCQGTAIDPAQKQTCTKCDGTGSTGACKTPHCVDGMIACPNTCLKAEMFTTPPDPKDGKRKKYFRGKNGATFWWSDGHIGQLIVYEDGNPVNKGVCRLCNGTSKIKDPACNGTGKATCADCHGKGVVGPKCPDCVGGEVKCATCEGTGMKKAA